MNRSWTLNGVSPAKTVSLAGLLFLALGTCSSSVEPTGRAAGTAMLSRAADERPEPNQLAAALSQVAASTEDQKQDLALARAVGSPPRAVVVDVRSARLWLLEHGQIVDTMKVVVGKSGMETPEMAGRIQYATLNPYWNVPPDLVRTRFAPAVVRHGSRYLAQQRFQVVDRYGLDARELDPQAIDWNEVLDGRLKVGIRQLPGPDNMMGTVKFIFPNNLGVYLHDTPGRWAFDREDRRLSSGCVRVERAGDLYAWLFGGELPQSSEPEHRVILTKPVPVYLLHFTQESSAALVRLT